MVEVGGVGVGGGGVQKNDFFFFWGGGVMVKFWIFLVGNHNTGLFWGVIYIFFSLGYDTEFEFFGGICIFQIFFGGCD